MRASYCMTLQKMGLPPLLYSVVGAGLQTPFLSLWTVRLWQENTARRCSNNWLHGADIYKQARVCGVAKQGWHNKVDLEQRGLQEDKPHHHTEVERSFKVNRWPKSLHQNKETRHIVFLKKDTSFSVFFQACWTSYWSTVKLSEKLYTFFCCQPKRAFMESISHKLWTYISCLRMNYSTTQ